MEDTSQGLDHALKVMILYPWVLNGGRWYGEEFLMLDHLVTNPRVEFYHLLGDVSEEGIT